MRIQFLTDVQNIHMEGTVSQIFFIKVLVFMLFQKTGNFCSIFET